MPGRGDEVSDTKLADGRYYEVAPPSSLADRVLTRARDRIYRDFLRHMVPRPHETILDVGVSDVVTDGANMIERLYPHPEKVTACGLGAAADFANGFPGIAYVRIEPNRPLPFADGAFDIATSNAVLEHVGSAANQQAFLAEMTRVARRVFVSVPHRFFPVEHHTAIPFAHFTDATFRIACRLAGKSVWADQKELILMSRGRLRAAAPAGVKASIGNTGLMLGPFSSNLYLALTGG